MLFPRIPSTEEDAILPKSEDSTKLLLLLIARRRNSCCCWNISQRRRRIACEVCVWWWSSFEFMKGSANQCVYRCATSLWFEPRTLHAASWFTCSLNLDTKKILYSSPTVCPWLKIDDRGKGASLNHTEGRCRCNMLCFTFIHYCSSTILIFFRNERIKIVHTV